MKKQLVEQGDVAARICKETRTFYADSSVILTPGAKDELNRLGVSIVYGPCPDTHCCAGTDAASAVDVEALLVGVAAMLKSEYGVEDPETLKSVSCEVVRTIKNTLVR